MPAEMRESRFLPRKIDFLGDWTGNCKGLVVSYNIDFLTRVQFTNFDQFSRKVECSEHILDL